MMSGLNTPITLTPLVATLLIILFIGLVTALSLALRHRFLHVKELNHKLAERKAASGTIPQEQLKQPVPDAYLHFIYNLSHEIANPLQSVQANLENMADCSPEETGRWRQYHTIIGYELKRLSTLTENLRLLAQLESADKPVKREPVNLKSVIEYVMMAQVERAEAKNITLSYQGPNRPARVLGNRELLQELVMNLVDNSIKYSKEMGGEIAIILQEDTTFTHILVKDTGVGIPENDLPFIFDTAYRSSNKLTVHRTGSGLGLAIVKRIVQQHEGTVSASSIFGEGTTITISLPVYKPN